MLALESATQTRFKALEDRLAALEAPPPPPEDAPAGIVVTPADNLQEAIDDAGVTPIYLRAGGPYLGGFKLRNATTLIAYPGEAPMLIGAKPVPPEIWKKSGNAHSIGWGQPFHQHPASQVRPGPAGLRHRSNMQPHMLIVDGNPMRTVFKTDDLLPGCIYIEGTAASPIRLWARFPDDRPPADFEVLAAVHQRVLYCDEKDVDGVHLEGLTLRYCANTGYQGMIDFPEMSNRWTLRKMDLQWSNTEGLRIMGAGHLLEDIHILNHGQSGISAEKMTDCTLDKVTTSYNNWKGFDQKWDAGNKIRNSKENVITNLFAAGNPIWFDIWNQGNRMQHFQIINAPCWGLHVEHNSSNNEFMDGVIRGATIYEDIADTGANLHIQGNIAGCTFARIKLEQGHSVHYKKTEVRGGFVNYSGPNTFDAIEHDGRWVIEGDPNHLPDVFLNMDKPAITVWSR